MNRGDYNYFPVSDPGAGVTGAHENCRSMIRGLENFH